MTSQGPALQKYAGSCHEVSSSDLGWTDSLTVLARIEIVTVLVH